LSLKENKKYNSSRNGNNAICINCGHGCKISAKLKKKHPELASSPKCARCRHEEAALEELDKIKKGTSKGVMVVMQCLDCRHWFMVQKAKLTPEREENPICSICMDDRAALRYRVETELTLHEPLYQVMAQFDGKTDAELGCICPAL